MTDMSTEIILTMILHALEHNASNYPNIIQAVEKVEDDTLELITVDGKRKFVTIGDV
jgi:hypothetical protein